MKDNKKCICLVGPDESYTGGMLTVIHQIMGSEIINDEYELIHIGSASREHKVLAFVKAISRLWGLGIRGKIDLIHIHLSERGSLYRTIIFIALSKILRVKTLVHSHGGMFFSHLSHKNKYVKKLLMTGLNGANAIVVLTPGWKEIWKEIVDENKIFVLPNGTNIPQEQDKEYLADNKLNLLFMGNISKIKGIYDLLDAVKIMAEKGTIPFVLRIAGGDEVEQCKACIAEKKIDDFCQVLGWIDGEKKEEVYRKSDLLLLPSYFESFGLVAIEAFARKIPVICGHLGFTKEVVDHGKNGYVAKTGDVEDIIKYIEMLYDKEKLKEFGSAGYVKVKSNYEIDVIMELLSQIYKEILS